MVSRLALSFCFCSFATLLFPFAFCAGLLPLACLVQHQFIDFMMTYMYVFYISLRINGSMGSVDSFLGI